MQVHIKYFASIREAMGQGAESLDTDANTLGQLRDALVARGGPGAQVLARDRVLRMALDQHLAEESALLRPGCEVAFFPPVTGG
jgi:molybdopterin synthase sulfur carrier subunit